MSRTGKYLATISGSLAILGGVAAVIVTRTDAGYRWFLDRMYRADFADVQTVEPAELERRIAAGERPLLLDTRAPTEYAVSHLHGALSVDPKDDADAAIAALRRENAADRPIVVYCSVGYRSGRIAQRLRAAGFTNVRNLYGGIFLWYNQGRRVVRGDSDVQSIHPYDFLWGQFITRGGKQYEP